MSKQLHGKDFFKKEMKIKKPLSLCNLTLKLESLRLLCSVQENSTLQEECYYSKDQSYWVSFCKHCGAQST